MPGPVSEPRRTSRSRLLHAVWWFVFCGLALGARVQHAEGQLAPAPDAAAEDTELLARARAHITRGDAAFELGDYRAALAEMQAAYDLLRGHPSRHLPLYNIAGCYQRLLQYDQAIAYYERFLSEAPEDDPTKAEVRGRLASLRELLGTLRIEASRHDAELWIDGHRVGTGKSTTWVSAGLHRVEARAPGFLDTQMEIACEARAERTLRITLSPIPKGRTLHPAYFWTSTSLSVASLAVGTYFGVDALGSRNEADQKRTAANPAERFELLDDDPRPGIRRSAATADVGFAVAGLFAATSVLLFAFTDFEKQQRARSHRRTSSLSASATKAEWRWTW